MVQEGPAVEVDVLVDVDLFGLVLEHIHELIELVGVDEFE